MRNAGCSRYLWLALTRKIFALSLFAAAYSLFAAEQKLSLEQRGADLEKEFAEVAHPFMKQYCFRCHAKDKPRGDFDMRMVSEFAPFLHDERRSEMILDQLSANQMPPEDARQPDADARAKVIAWIKAVRRYEGERNAGDPGIVLARRLSNAEYDYTIRDLTGQDLRPTREFPVDPANEAGFDNSGESLSMSPALLKKYLSAARKIASHVVLKPVGLEFAPYPMLAETDRDKYVVRQIIDFYRNQPTNCAPYFFAAWKYKHRSVAGRSTVSLEELADQQQISPKYLKLIWSNLAGTNSGPGPIAAVQALWNELPAQGDEKAIFEQCRELAAFVADLRERVKVKVENLNLSGANPGTQALVLWKDREMARNRRGYGGGAFDLSFDDFVSDPAARKALTVPESEAERAAFEADFRKFCDLFPDAFYVAERARIFMNAKEDKDNVGRFLSAGFHNQFGYFRDDQPLCELILSEDGKRHLDELWRELDFISLAPLRQYSSSIWYDRAEASFIRGAEFDFVRAEDKDIASPEKFRDYVAVYMAKVRRNTDNETVIRAFEDHFRILEASIRSMERDRLEAEPVHLNALVGFAARAYRRPVTETEREDLLAFYRTLRKESGLDHEEAMRECLVSLFMSPDFMYRIDAVGAGDAVQPLSDYALASRLSYFLWSSMPDPELLEHAAAGDLHERSVLLSQTRRMLRDGRVRRLATEFGGNWLEFRRFEEHNAVDRERFKTFDNELRWSMFEEPVRFLLDVVQRDRSILDLVFANDTFVNPALARHYGIPEFAGSSNTWVHVEDASKYGRGGLLPMSVFLTKNAPGLRTSPVKRGYWVVRRLLGEHIPPPPPKVPELPADESKLQLSLRETLAKHREDSSCAACHARFDSFGLVFEGFGPVGERRTVDLAGRAVDIRAPFPDGQDREGLEGLREYIREYRQRDFVENVSRKLLAYALGRGLILSDELLVEQMRANLEANGYHFSHAIETIVTSPQFLTRRGAKNFTAN